MKVTINRNFCGHPPASCEACFGEFLRRGAVPDRSCIVDVIEDESPIVTAKIISGKYEGTLIIDDKNRQAIIAEGYMKYADLPPEAFDIVAPHGDEIRRMIREQGK